VGLLAEESLGSDTNPKDDGTDGFSLSDLDKANDVYGRPEDPLGIQELANLGTQLLSDNVKLMAEDWAELLQLAISLESGGHNPRCGPRTVH
jgi:hypothetical protein